MTASADLQVWLLELEALRPALERLEQRRQLLADDERRAGTMGSGRAGRDRRAVRIALRLLFAREGLGALVSQPLERGASGKPRLAGAGLDFSVSHSGDHALIALCRNGPVGVDLEPPRNVRIGEPRRSQIAAAGAALARRRGDAPIDAREDAELLCAWTRLEAWAKARGSGIGALLTDLGLLGTASRAASPEAAAERARRLAAVEDIAVADLALPGDLVGALAARPGALPERLPVARLAVPA
jgi:4'-phosphopantetheinyl transferase